MSMRTVCIALCAIMSGCSTEVSITAPQPDCSGVERQLLADAFLGCLRNDNMLAKGCRVEVKRLLCLAVKPDGADE